MKNLGRVAMSMAALAFLSTAACSGDAEVEDGADDSFSSGKADSLTEGSREATAVLRLVNDPTVTFEELDIDAGLSKSVARRIIDKRNGPDRLVSTADDDRYDTLAELDVNPLMVSESGAVAVDALIVEATAST